VAGFDDGHPTEFATLGVTCGVPYRRGQDQKTNGFPHTRQAVRWPKIPHAQLSGINPTVYESETNWLLILCSCVKDAASQHGCCKSRAVVGFDDSHPTECAALNVACGVLYRRPQDQKTNGFPNTRPAVRWPDSTTATPLNSQRSGLLAASLTEEDKTRRQMGSRTRGRRCGGRQFHTRSCRGTRSKRMNQKPIGF
jgi:hypothetical protein